MDYDSYRLADGSPHYEDEAARHISKMGKRLEFLVELQMFDRSDAKTFLIPFTTVQRSCDTNGIHEAAAICLFQLFMKSPAGATLSARNCQTSSYRSCQERKLISYCQMVNNSLNTFSTAHIINEVDANIIKYKQLKEHSTSINHSHFGSGLTK